VIAQSERPNHISLLVASFHLSQLQNDVSQSFDKPEAERRFTHVEPEVLSFWVASSPLQAISNTEVSASPAVMRKR
jgi:hypothetical protein